MYFHCSSLVVVGSILYTTFFVCQVAITIFTIYTFNAYCTVFSCNEVICSSIITMFFFHYEMKCYINCQQVNFNKFLFKKVIFVCAQRVFRFVYYIDLLFSRVTVNCWMNLWWKLMWTLSNKHWHTYNNRI